MSATQTHHKASKIYRQTSEILVSHSIRSYTHKCDRHNKSTRATNFPLKYLSIQGVQPEHWCMDWGYGWDEKQEIITTLCWDDQEGQLHLNCFHLVQPQPAVTCTSTCWTEEPRSILIYSSVRKESTLKTLHNTHLSPLSRVAFMCLWKNQTKNSKDNLRRESVKNSYKKEGGWEGKSKETKPEDICLPVFSGFAHHMSSWSINIFQTAEWKGFLVQGCLPKGGKWMDVWELNELSGRKLYRSCFVLTQGSKIQVSNIFFLIWNLYLTIDLTIKNKFIVHSKKRTFTLVIWTFCTHENWNVSYNCAIQRFSRNKQFLVNSHSDLGQRSKTAVTVLMYWLWLNFFNFVPLIPSISVEVILFKNCWATSHFTKSVNSGFKHCTQVGKCLVACERSKWLERSCSCK